MKKIGEIAVVLLLMILAVAGVAAMLRQLVEGLSLTGLGEPVAWGMYVVGFAYFAGVGAGALTWTAAILRWGNREQQKLVKPGAVAALAGLMAAGLFINMDLGRPDRVWRFIVNANLQSPLVLDFLFMNVMMGLASIFTIYSLRATLVKWLPRRLEKAGQLVNHVFEDKETDGNAPPEWLRSLSLITVLTTPVMYLLMTRVFSTLQARPEWNTTGMGLTFLGSSLLAGGAAILLSARLLGAGDTKSAAATPLVHRIVIGLILFELALVLGPMLTLRQFSGDPRLASIAHIDMIWMLEIGLGLAVPLLLLLLGLQKRLPKVLTPASLLILTGIFLKRWHIIVPAMRERALPLARGVYSPTVHEYVVAGGIVAIVALLLYFVIGISENRFGFSSRTS